MSETRALMRDFRFLDEKRKVGGLSPAEEGRWLELRAVLGIAETPTISSQPAPQGYWADDGNWYPYPYAQPQQSFDPNAGWQGGGESAWDPWASANAQGGYAPDPNWGHGYGQGEVSGE